MEVEINVKKAQHRFVVGRRRGGLDEIFRETEVLVEIPNEESASDTITLRGPKEKIGDAVGAGFSEF